jgi:serine/threonine protein kinase
MYDLVGKTLGKYQIIERLYQTAGTEVYKGFHPAMNRYVVLNVLKAALSENQAILQRFLEQNDIAAKIQHPNLLPLIDFGEENGIYYRVLVYGPEGDWSENKRWFNNNPAIVRLFSQLTAALSEVHSFGYVFLNLRPANIFFGEGRKAMLGDFGIALSPELSRNDPFCSPEVSRREPVDQRADIYALGVLLYELLTGSPPDMENYMSLRSLRPDLPEEVEKIILKALSDRPEDRYQTVNEFQSSLEEAFQYTDRSADSPVQQTDKRKGWLIALVTVLILLCLGAITVFALTRGDDDENDVVSEATLTVTPEDFALTQTAEASCTNSASFVEHVTTPIDTTVTANSNFTKTWRVNNDGSCDWSGYQVVHSSGNIMGANSPRALPVVNAGDNADIAVDMVAPETPGTHSAIWRIQAEDGTQFGPELIVTIIVPELPTETPTSTTLPTSTQTPTSTETLTPTPTSEPLSIQQISEEITIQPNTTVNRTVNCPSNSVVVSGGFSQPLGIRVWQSRKNGNGWSVSATNDLTQENTLTLSATCLFNSGGTSIDTFTQQNAKPNGITELTTNCPSGSFVTGGGWVIDENNEIQVQQSSGSGNGWKIIINNPTNTTPLINVFAVCLSGAPGSTSQEVRTENMIPPNQTSDVEKLCPSGTFVTGGGFNMALELNLSNTSMFQNGWINSVFNPTGEAKRLDTFAICYSP